MVRRLANAGSRLQDLARGHAVRKRGGQEQVIQSHVRIPSRKRVAVIVVKLAIRVGVMGVEHQLNRSPANGAARHPDHGAQAEGKTCYVQLFAWSERVEVARYNMKAGLVRGDVFFWGELMAGALLGSIPVAFVYSFFVEYYVSGITGSVKG